MKGVVAYAIVVGLVVVGRGTAASAAEPQQSPADGPKLVVRVVGGLVPDTATRGNVLGVGAGVGFGPDHRIEVLGEFGHLSNTMSAKVLSVYFLNFNHKDLLPDDFYGPTDHYDFDAMAPAKYFVALGHVELVKTGHVGVFVEGGAGRMHTDIHASVTINGIDRTAELTTRWTNGKLIGGFNFGMYVIGAGGSVHLGGHASIDAGLRIAFVPNGDYPLNTTQAFVGFVWRQ